MPIDRDPDYQGPLGVPNTPQLWREVRALILTSPHFRGACREIDGDDLLQEIMLSVFKKQHGASAFDRRKASLGRYVRMVTYSVTANQVDKVWRRKRRETHAIGEAWTVDKLVKVEVCEDMSGLRSAIRKAERRTGKRVLARGE